MGDKGACEIVSTGSSGSAAGRAVDSAMATVVFANVALRFLTDNSILWVEELSRYLMIWLTFLGAGLVLRYGGHVASKTCGEISAQAATLRIIIFALMLGFFVFVFVGWRSLRHFPPGDKRRGDGHPRRRHCIAMPIGFALLILHALIMMRARLR